MHLERERKDFKSRFCSVVRLKASDCIQQQELAEDQGRCKTEKQLLQRKKLQVR